MGLSAPSDIFFLFTWHAPSCFTFRHLSISRYFIIIFLCGIVYPSQSGDTPKIKDGNNRCLHKNKKFYRKEKKIFLRTTVPNFIHAFQNIVTFILYLCLVCCCSSFLFLKKQHKSHCTVIKNAPVGFALQNFCLCLVQKCYKTTSFSKFNLRYQ